MAVGVELILLDDPAFQKLPPSTRWFYVALSLEILDSGEHGRRVEYNTILKLAGMTREEASSSIQELEEAGLIVRENKTKINLPKAELHFRRYKDLNNNIAPNDRKEDVLQVFRHWQNVHGKHRRKLTPVRRKLIRQRLQDGFTVNELKMAIDGCKASPFHQGDNNREMIYDDLSLILRNEEKVEKFIGYKENFDRTEGSEAAQTYVERSLKESETENQKAPPKTENRMNLIKTFRKRTLEDDDLFGFDE